MFFRTFPAVLSELASKRGRRHGMRIGTHHKKVSIHFFFTISSSRSKTQKRKRRVSGAETMSFGARGTDLPSDMHLCDLRAVSRKNSGISKGPSQGRIWYVYHFDRPGNFERFLRQNSLFRLNLKAVGLTCFLKYPQKQILSCTLARIWISHPRLR